MDGYGVWFKLVSTKIFIIQGVLKVLFMAFIMESMSGKSGYGSKVYPYVSEHAESIEIAYSASRSET